MIYYVSGIPYSDELWHSGVLGQKWGNRRYQNPDGTLTALGRVHYGYKSAANTVGNAAKATGKAVGSAAKKVAKYESDKFKRNHPWLMSDQELDAALAKAKKIDTLTQTRQNIRGRSFVGKLSSTLWKSVGVGTDKLMESTATNLGKGFAEKMLKSKTERKADSIEARMRLMDKQTAMYKKKTQDDLGNARKNYREKIKNDAADSAKRISSNIRKQAQKTEYERLGRQMYEASRERVKQEASATLALANKSRQEAERRRKIVEDMKRKVKYGPGGTAYR